MSHAANLRNHQHSADFPTKRRKLSENSTRPQTNGVKRLCDPQQNHRLAAHTIHDAKSLTQRQTDESVAKVSRGDGDTLMTDAPNGVIEISSGAEDSDSDDDSLVEEERYTGLHTPQSLLATNGHDRALGKTDNVNPLPDRSKLHAADTVAGTQEVNATNSVQDEPSFGELLRARDNEQIDVSTADQDATDLQALAGSSSKPVGTLQVPSAASLGTVLTQALRSNDTSLLEACLQVPNLQSIRATIERLPSMHAATLLQKLAERMHKRPGRSGSLMVWVQWTVVAHGGFLASQPAAMAQLKELYRVVKLRAAALQPLLALKGKLDMLEAQMELRRHRAGAGATKQQDEDVIYVEGEDSDDELTGDAPIESTKLASSSKATDFPTFDDSEGDDPMPLTNGVSATASLAEDEEDSDDSDDEEDGLIDDQADSTDNDSDAMLSDDEVDFDNDEQEDGSGSEQQQRPIKRSRS